MKSEFGVYTYTIGNSIFVTDFTVTIDQNALFAMPYQLLIDRAKVILYKHFDAERIEMNKLNKVPEEQARKKDQDYWINQRRFIEDKISLFESSSELSEIRGLREKIKNLAEKLLVRDGEKDELIRLFSLAFGQRFAAGAIEKYRNNIKEPSEGMLVIYHRGKLTMDKKADEPKNKDSGYNMLETAVGGGS